MNDKKTRCVKVDGSDLILFGYVAVNELPCLLLNDLELPLAING
jgi:hypothetical protein